MPEKTIEEVISGGSSEPVEELAHEPIGMDEPQAQTKGFGSLFEKLRTPASEKPIDEYKDHAFNRTGSENVGRFIRGIEAYLGNTNLALFDVIFGALGMMEERKGQSSNTEVSVHGI